jgi:Peptidase family M23
MVFTAFVVEPLISPRPVDGADGRTHLVYELSFVNETTVMSRIDSITAFNPETDATLGEWKGDDLKAIFRLNGRELGVSVARGHSGYAFLDATLAKGALIPKTIRHRISTTRFMTSPDDEHKGVPLDPKLGVAAQATFEGADVEVDPHKAVVIAPPLRGPGWVDTNGCCRSLGHRGAVMAFNGKAFVPERFAIDFVQLDSARRLFVGSRQQNESYPTYGNPVFAVADGVVVEASDGASEQVPFAPREPPAIETAAGNHVVLDIGDGNFALFAHLKTGTVVVKQGDRVKAGQVIGHVGDTGNSDAPHLHFHVMDGPSPLAANGVPYAFTSFLGAGQLNPDSADDVFAKGEPAAIDADWLAGGHAAELPLDGEIVDFPAQ